MYTQKTTSIADLFPDLTALAKRPRSNNLLEAGICRYRAGIMKDWAELAL